jgi:hypothetical protein
MRTACCAKSHRIANAARTRGTHAHAYYCAPCPPTVVGEGDLALCFCCAAAADGVSVVVSLITLRSCAAHASLADRSACFQPPRLGSTSSVLVCVFVRLSVC